MDTAAREAAARADMQREAETSDGSRRATKRTRKVPVANSEPDETVLKTLVGWRQPLDHPSASCKPVLGGLTSDNAVNVPDQHA
jgi:hypothetical protein